MSLRPTKCWVCLTWRVSVEEVGQSSHSQGFHTSNRHPLRPWPHGQLQVWIGKRQSGEWPERNRILPFRPCRVVFEENKISRLLVPMTPLLTTRKARVAVNGAGMWWPGPKCWRNVCLMCQAWKTPKSLFKQDNFPGRTCLRDYIRSKPPPKKRSWITSKTCFGKGVGMILEKKWT